MTPIESSSSRRTWIEIEALKDMEARRGGVLLAGGGDRNIV